MDRDHDCLLFLKNNFECQNFPSPLLTNGLPNGSGPQESCNKCPPGSFFDNLGHCWNFDTFKCR
ncbi:MAG: hypothetical protein Hyperionvirus14_32 [Hyperionvirus sp.]|uniref:Uncharacterized protein n=1 Tax=Hyperionvirus sp. TaxID=2487770 RepID=A0A3G5ADH4_9VIRU|nr:MAG: hypothetical protein Hyperionvirus14_32 [Hyperionvirus sp.]